MFLDFFFSFNFLFFTRRFFIKRASVKTRNFQWRISRNQRKHLFLVSWTEIGRRKMLCSNQICVNLTQAHPSVNIFWCDVFSSSPNNEIFIAQWCIHAWMFTSMILCSLSWTLFSSIFHPRLRKKWNVFVEDWIRSIEISNHENDERDFHLKLTATHSHFSTVISPSRFHLITNLCLLQASFHPINARLN